MLDLSIPLTDDVNDESQNVQKPVKSKPIPYRRPISTANAKPPQKGILKPAPQPSARSTWKRDWFAALQNVANVTATSASSSNAASYFTNTLKRLSTAAITSNSTPTITRSQEENQQHPQTIQQQQQQQNQQS